MRGRQAWQLRMQSAAITIAIVAAGGVVQFYLAQAGEAERLRRLNYEACSIARCIIAYVHIMRVMIACTARI